MGVFNLFKKKKTEEDNKPTSRFIDDEWLEVSAASKEEAIERACMALNTNPSHLEIKMLSKDGKKLQARKTNEQQARSAAPSRDAQPRQPRSNQPRPQGRGGERNNNNRNDRNANSRNDRNDRNAGPRGGHQSRPTRGPAPRNDRNQPRPQNMRDDEQTDETLMSDGEYRGGNDEYSYNNARNTNGGRGRGSESNEHYDDVQDQHAQPQGDRYQEEDVVEEVEEETDLGRKAKDILIQIIQKIDANAKAELYETNKTIRLEIISSESGLFIGKFGQTLDSIQHILKKILEIKFEDGKNLVVDAEDYRVRREESIESKARKLAKKARQEGRPVSVEPMNAMDRRIVHMALKGEPGIETKSVGEGSSRRVLIVPKRRASSGRNGGGRNDNGGRGRGRGQGQSRGGFRGREGGNTGPARDGNTRMHDSYDVPALPKSDVFGDNPEEYMEFIDKDDEK